MKASDAIRQLKRISSSSFQDFREYKVTTGNYTKKITQGTLIDDMHNHKDTLARIPTGMGKTLCFQGAAISSEGLTIVITPLKSLCKDQVDEFNNEYCKQFIDRPHLYIDYCNCEIGKKYQGALPRAAYPGLYNLGTNNFINELATGDIARKK